MRYIESSKIKKELGAVTGDFAKKSWLIKAGKVDKYFIPFSPHGSALDLGCGSGSTALYLKKFFSSVDGADIESYLTDEAEAQIKFSSADLNFEKLPYLDKSFDVVLALQVVEHLENPFYIMREAARVLRPGGYFIMSIPNPYQLSARIKFLFTGNMTPYRLDNNHLLFMTKDVFKKTYLDLFTLEEVLYQKGDIPLWGRLRFIFGKKVGKHKKMLPPSESFSRCLAYVLRKKEK